MKLSKILSFAFLGMLVLAAFGSFQAAQAETTILLVKKDAFGSFDKSWDWTINKTGSETSLTLSAGQQHQVNYTVRVEADGSESWTVEGTIAFRNVSTETVQVASINDVLSNGTVATVSCPFSFPRTMNPGNTAPECTYTASGTGAHPASNTVTVNLVGGAVGGTTTVPVVYSGSTETDECVDVSDTLGGNFGTVCASQAPKTFSYSYMVGPFAACTTNKIVNTASFVTNDTSTTGEAKWTVTATVPCAGGCTLTPGYWKTHSSNGPAPYDNTWAQIGENTTFFLSGKSYYSALWTSPQGNAYYILAHAYIAAKLNFLNGASSPAAVTTAFTTATGLFQTYTPAQIGALKGSDALRQQFVSLASTLDNYNNGLTGPGHCDE